MLDHDGRYVCDHHKQLQIGFLKETQDAEDGWSLGNDHDVYDLTKYIVISGHFLSQLLSLSQEYEPVQHHTEIGWIVERSHGMEYYYICYT